MILQFPAIFLSEKLKGTQFGNFFFWCMIMIGQPFIVLILYQEWYIKNYKNQNFPKLIMENWY